MLQGVLLIKQSLTILLVPAFRYMNIMFGKLRGSRRPDDGVDNWFHDAPTETSDNRCLDGNIRQWMLLCFPPGENMS